MFQWLNGLFAWFTTTTIGKILTTIGVSMVPVIELRGAIPIGVGMGLSPWTAFVLGVIGNMIPVPFILLFIVSIFDWMRKRKGFLGKVADKMVSIAEKKHDTVDKYGWIGLFILVAIPLPGTGAWTGALVAGVFRIPFWKAMAAIFLGVLAAGIIVLAVSYGAFSVFS